MPTPTELEILIKIRDELSGLQRSQEAFRDMRKEAMSMDNMLATGAGIGGGIALFNTAVQALKRSLMDTLDVGVNFNQNLQGAAIGIAAVLRQFDDAGKFKTFGAAMTASADAIDLLKEKALVSPASFQELVQAFQGTVGAMMAAGIPLQRQVDLIVNMSQALSGLGIRSEQILQETRALITGNINADAAAAKILGISAADIAGAKEQGQLYEFLAGKIAAFAEAADVASGTLQQLKSNFGDAFEQQAAKQTEALTAAMAELYGQLGEFVGTDDFGAFLKLLADGATKLTGDLTSLVGWVDENAQAIKTLGEIVIWTASAMTGLKLLGKVAAGGGIWAKALSGTQLKNALRDFPTLFASAMTMALARGKAVMASGGAGLGKALGKSIATPMGAAIVVAIGAAVIEGVKNYKLAQDTATNARRDQDILTAQGVRDAIANARTEQEIEATRRQALVQRNAMQTRFAAAQATGDEQEMAHLNTLVGLYDQLAQFDTARSAEIIAQNRALDEQAAIAAQIKQADDALIKARDNMVSNAGAAAGANAKARFDAMDPEAQRRELQRQQDAAQAAYDSRPGYRDLIRWGRVPKNEIQAEQDKARIAAKERELQLEADLLVARKRLADFDEAVAAEREKEAKQAEERAADELRELEQQQRARIDAQLIEQQAAVDQLAYERERAGDIADVATRRSVELSLIGQQRVALERIVELQRELVALANDPVAKANAEAALAGARRTLGSLGAGTVTPQSRAERSVANFDRYQNGQASDGTAALGVGESFGVGAMDWVTSLGSAGEQIAGTLQGTIGTAVDGISQGIHGWMSGTSDFGDALLDIGDSVLSQLIDMVVQMGVQWVLTGSVAKATMTGLSALGSMLRGKETAETLAAESAKAPALQANAAAASASSFGLSAVIGLALLAALLAAFTFRERGGDMQAGRPYIVGERRAEVFVPDQPGTMHPSVDDYVARYGSGQNLAASLDVPGMPTSSPMGAGAAGAAAALAAGMAAAAGAGRQGDRPMNVAFFGDNMQAAKDWAESQEGDAWFYDTMRRKMSEFVPR